MAGTVASIASGVLGNAANSKGDSVLGGNNVSNNNIAPQTETPQINQAEVKEAAKPVEKNDSGSNWQQLAQMAQGLMNTAQGSAPAVSGGNISQNQSVANFRQGHVMAEKDKTIHDEDSFGTRIKKDPLSLLDITNDIEQIPIGPNEIERNNSRLRKIVTEEPRPASHTAKEVVAWTASNIGLPLLAAGIKSASVANKGRKGLKAINAIDNVSDSQAAIKEAEKLAKEALEEATKK